MDGNKAVRKYSEQEVTEDPLLVLACGHVLPMTSMDGYMELRSAYTTDKHGKWHKPCQMKVQMASSAQERLFIPDAQNLFCRTMLPMSSALQCADSKQASAA